MSQVNFPKKSIFFCDGSKCGKHKEVRKIFKESIKKHHLQDQVEIFKMECSDRCKHAPVMCFQPNNQWFSDVSIWQAEKIFTDNIL